MAFNEVINNVNLEIVTPKTQVTEKTYISKSYHEIPNTNLEVDIIEQLHANLRDIEDLQARLKFMMSEVKGLVKK